MATELQDEVGIGVGDIPQIQTEKDAEGRETISTSALLVLSTTLRTIIEKFRGGISLGSGFNGFKAGSLDAGYADVITPGAANTEFVVLHRLGRVPVGFQVVYKDAAVDVYASSLGSWTDRLMYLKANAGSATIKLMVW